MIKKKKKMMMTMTKRKKKVNTLIIKVPRHSFLHIISLNQSLECMNTALIDDFTCHLKSKKINPKLLIL